MGERPVNMFDLLSEDGAKKNQKKEAAAPAKQDKGKGKAPAAKSGDAPAKKASNNNQQGNQQGGRGGQNRGRGRGEGRGRGRGRGEGRGRGGDGSFPVEERNNSGNNNNRGRQVSRRQRDEAFKKGDYGSPDAEGRSKRPYDKFSHSQGARRKQEKKGGHGAGNWGEKGKEENPPADEEEKKEDGEEGEEKAEGEDKAEGEEAEKDESENEIDYDQYLENKKKEQEELAKIQEKQEVRQVDNAEFEGMKQVSKGNKKDVDFFPGAGGKKKGKKGASQKEGKMSVDKVLDVQAPRNDNRRGKGRQNNRPNHRKNVNLTLDDDKDFPSLGK